MKITVLGKYGPFEAAGGCCSGYLIEDKDTKILIDCGNGVLSNLQKVCSLTDINAIVLSHLHSDHISDVFVLRYALDILTMRKQREAKPICVYAPNSPTEQFSSLQYKNVFSVKPIDENLELRIGALTLSFKQMTHPVKSYAVCVKNENSKFVYTGDTSYNDKIEGFAANADLFAADCGLLERDYKENAPHMTAAQAAKVAKMAGVKKFLITHIFPFYNEVDLFNEASQYYNNPIVAQELNSYEV